LRNLYFVVLAAFLLVALSGTLVRYYLRARRSAGDTWEDLLRRLTWIDREAIATIALDALGPLDERGNPRPQDESFALEPDTIWKLLGGLDGLEVVERNCRVLVDLATYLQRYYPEALVVAEQLRLNAREIEWHVGRLKGAARTGNLRSSFTDYAQRAVVTYYRMTRLLLDLCDHAGAPGLVQLQQAI
jgi:hypothetical protein